MIKKSGILGLQFLIKAYPNYPCHFIRRVADIPETMSKTKVLKNQVQIYKELGIAELQFFTKEYLIQPFCATFENFQLSLVKSMRDVA